MSEHLDRLLAAARPTPLAPRPRYDFALGRRRAAERLTEHQARQQRADTGSGLNFHDHAERDLSSLAMMVIGDPGAAEQLASLDSSAVDPRGGLVFACLLHLTNQPQEAQWWFQFAAGAGERDAVFCLYLHHIRLGELREAEHYFELATSLRSEPSDAEADRATVIPPSLPALPGYFADAEWLCQYVQAGERAVPPGRALREKALQGPLGARRVLRDETVGCFSLPPEPENGDIADSMQVLISN
ncbi:hypothetical protein CFP65_6442 [Kitasatospora sp. MMS16-BH015]|uniref:hypothetical protein n=1 Tax=Kitasatospora sp. MMS16-BH015 TaxID=2018025 RepID=UPI000CA333E8|nr:hypothetical protein [Kitasatospora sp. MMS16-BH015]AUG81098.1 hypothetical protein CFP65_6442 [Kitasatospora sp. MMS16-BH015]